MNFACKWMELDRKYHPDSKLHAWYILTGKWILAKKYRIPRIQTRQSYLEELISKRRKLQVRLYINKISSEDKARLGCMG